MTSPTPRPWLALLVAFVALSVALGGTGYAALVVTGKNVKNGSLTGKDVKDASLTARDLRGSVTGPAGPTGPSGPRGAAGSARAFGGVTSGGTRNTIFGAGGDTDFTPRRVSTGIYCIAVPGISKNDARIFANPDVSDGVPRSAGTRSSAADCVGDEFEVWVFGAGGALVDSGFVFMIP
jgi:hypothetical protein